MQQIDQMKQKYSFGDCYQILLIKPDCDWEELRKSYKLLMKKWHPDRFDANSPEKLIAEDKVKYITAAYKQLSEYHRIHGVLPSPIYIEKPCILSSYNPDTIIGNSDDLPDRNYNADIIHNGSSYILRFFIILIVLCFFIYIAFIRTPEDYTNSLPSQPSLINSKATNNSIPHNTNAKEQRHDRSIISSNELSDKNNKLLETSEFTSLVEKSNEADTFFTHGSSIGEVISIQGAPSRIEGDTWFYGESEVYFSDGVVLNWKRMSGSPLKARIKLGNTNIETIDLKSNTNKQAPK